jgi:Fe-S cluster biogenesis protein NfuA
VTERDPAGTGATGHDVARVLSRVMRAHGGGLELTRAGPDAEVRFTGMCAGCASRPLCLENLVAPALLALDTVTSVTAPGARADPAALDRFRSLSRRQDDPPEAAG